MKMIIYRVFYRCKLMMTANFQAVVICVDIALVVAIRGFMDFGERYDVGTVGSD
jgi:hypothetical protein